MTGKLVNTILALTLTGTIASGCIKPKALSPYLFTETPRVGQILPEPKGIHSGRGKVISPYHSFPSISKIDYINPEQSKIFTTCKEDELGEQVGFYDSGTQTLAIDKNRNKIIDEVIHNLSQEHIAEEIAISTAPCP